MAKIQQLGSQKIYDSSKGRSCGSLQKQLDHQILPFEIKVDQSSGKKGLQKPILLGTESSIDGGKHW